MTNYVHVAEFSDLGAAHQSTDLLAVDVSSLTSSYQVVSSATAANGPAFQSANPPQSGPTGQAAGSVSRATKWLYLVADTASNVSFGTAPTATTATGMYLPAGIPVIVRVPAGLAWEISVIAAD